MTEVDLIWSIQPFFFISAILSILYFEVFEKRSILFKFKEDEDFNHSNTLSISRIELKLHFV